MNGRLFVDGGARRWCGDCGCAWAGGAGKFVSKHMATKPRLPSQFYDLPRTALHHTVGVTRNAVRLRSASPAVTRNAVYQPVVTRNAVCQPAYNALGQFWR